MATMLPPKRVAKPTGRTAPKPKTVTAKPAMVKGPFGAKLAGTGGGGKKVSPQRG